MKFQPKKLFERLCFVKFEHHDLTISEVSHYEFLKDIV
jgi:hypothetical protein